MILYPTDLNFIIVPDYFEETSINDSNCILIGCMDDKYDIDFDINNDNIVLDNETYDGQTFYKDYRFNIYDLDKYSSLMTLISEHIFYIKKGEKLVLFLKH